MPVVAPSLPGFLLEGFEERDDEDDDNKDKRKGSQDGAGLQAFESPGPEEDCGRQRLNDAPGEFNSVGRVKAAVGGERPKYESGGIR